MKIGSLGCGRKRRQRYDVSEAFEPPYQATSHMVGIELVQIEVTQVVVGNVLRELWSARITYAPERHGARLADRCQLSVVMASLR